MKKVLVTGATGFIGNYVVRELLESNYKVIATSSSEAKAMKMDWFASVRYIKFDLKETDEAQNYFEFFEKPDLLIHLAWEGLPNYKEAFHVTENLPGHFSFLKNLINNGLQDISIAGTCLEYGMQEGCLSENLASQPANNYAIAKDSLRKQLQKLQTEIAFSLKWIRLFYMYGAGQSPNSLFSQLNDALERNDPAFNMSGGEQVRDYLPVEKVAAYIVKIATQKDVTGIFNCSSGIGLPLKKIVSNYLKEKNKIIQLNLGFYPYTDYEPMQFWGDDKKLKSLLKNE